MQSVAGYENGADEISAPFEISRRRFIAAACRNGNRPARAEGDSRRAPAVAGRAGYGRTAAPIPTAYGRIAATSQ